MVLLVILRKMELVVNTLGVNLVMNMKMMALLLIRKILPMLILKMKNNSLFNIVL